MSRTLRTVVTLDDHVDAALVTQFLRRKDGFDVLKVADGDTRGEALDVAADLVVVGCGGDSERAIALVASAVEHRPDTPVVVIASSPLNGQMEGLFTAGADDIVVLPDDSERVVFAIEKAVVRKRRPSAPREARVVTVLGPKGGSGKTFISSNLGVALARAGRHTTLLDLDLQFGDLALALGLNPRRTLYDLARAGGNLDCEKLDGFAVVHESGARALLAPLRPDEAGAVGSDLLNEIWATLRPVDDYVVVDTAAGFPPEVIAAIDAADDIVLVGTLDAGSLKDTKLGLETVGLMGRDPSQVIVVLNRANSKVGIELRDVSAILGRPPDVFVPSERAVARSLNEGRPIVAASPRSHAARAITSLTERLLGREPAQAASGGHGSTRRAA